jgi:hypothetical protein
MKDIERYNHIFVHCDMCLFHLTVDKSGMIIFTSIVGIKVLFINSKF